MVLVNLCFMFFDGWVYFFGFVMFVVGVVEWGLLYCLVVVLCVECFVSMIIVVDGCGYGILF